MRRIALLVLALAGAASPAAAADGARLFALQCRACHGPASTPAGPALTGIVGAQIAGRTDFKYSPALQAKDGTWTVETLDAFLAAPTKFAPGARMPVGVANAEQRAAIIEHLRTLK